MGKKKIRSKRAGKPPLPSAGLSHSYTVSTGTATNHTYSTSVTATVSDINFSNSTTCSSWVSQKKDDISWWMTVKKWSLWLWFAERKQKHQERKHCKKGYHKIEPSMQSRTTSTGQHDEVHYFRCNTCNAAFFVKKEDKELYLKLKKENTAFFGTLFANMEKKDGKGKA